MVVLEIRIRDNLCPFHFVTDEFLISNEAIDRSFVLVGSALCHRVDAGAGKAAFANIKGGKRNLHLLYSVEWDGLSIGLSARSRIIETKGIVEIGAVKRDVVEEPVLSAEAEIPIASGIQAREVPGAPLHRGQLGRFNAINIRCRPSSPAVHDFVNLSRHNHLRTGNRFFRQSKVDSQILSNAEIDIGLALPLVSKNGSRDSVWTSDLHVQNVELSIRSRGSSISSAARLMDSDDVGAGQSFSLVAHNDAGQGRRCNTLGMEMTA